MDQCGLRNVTYVYAAGEIERHSSISVSCEYGIIFIVRLPDVLGNGIQGKRHEWNWQGHLL